jgi:phage-related protein
MAYKKITNNTSTVGFCMLLVQKNSIAWNNTSHVGFYMLLVQKNSIAWNNTSHVGFYMLLVQKNSIAWNNTSHVGFYMLLVQKNSIAWNNTSHVGFYNRSLPLRNCGSLYSHQANLSYRVLDSQSTWEWTEIRYKLHASLLPCRLEQSTRAQEVGVARLLFYWLKHVLVSHL